MFLGVDLLLTLVHDEKLRLVEGLSDRELNNPEGAGFDLRVGDIYSLKDDPGFLGESERKTPEVEIVASFADSVEGEIVTLAPKSFHLLRTVETVNLPLDLVGVLEPRSTLFRSGLILSSSQINPGYSGKLTLGIQNASEYDFALQIGARFVHLMVARIEGESGGYRGQWQGGRVWTEREKQV